MVGRRDDHLPLRQRVGVLPGGAAPDANVVIQRLARFKVSHKELTAGRDP